METRSHNKYTVYDPSQKQVIGRRTGKVIEIRNGMKSIDDFFSDSEADATMDITRHTPIVSEVEFSKQSTRKKSVGKPKHESTRILPNTGAKGSRKPTRLGRRTGKDFFAGKSKLSKADGIGNFSDFFSDTDASMSLHPTPERTISSASMASCESGDNSSRQLRSSQRTKKTKRNRSSISMNLSNRENENSVNSTKKDPPLSSRSSARVKSNRRSSLFNKVQTETNLPLTNVGQSQNRSSNKSFQNEQSNSPVLSKESYNVSSSVAVEADIHNSEEQCHEDRTISLDSHSDSSDKEIYSGKENYKPISDKPTMNDEIVENEVQRVKNHKPLSDKPTENDGTVESEMYQGENHEPFSDKSIRTNEIGEKEIQQVESHETNSDKPFDEIEDETQVENHEPISDEPTSVNEIVEDEIEEVETQETITDQPTKVKEIFEDQTEQVENHEPLAEDPARGNEIVEDELEQVSSKSSCTGEDIETEDKQMQQFDSNSRRAGESHVTIEKETTVFLLESNASNHCDTSYLPHKQIPVDGSMVELRQVTPMEPLPSTSDQPALQFGGTTTGSVSNTDKVLANQFFGIKKRLTYGQALNDTEDSTELKTNISFKRKSCPGSFLDHHSKDKSVLPVSTASSVDTDGSGESSDNFCIVDPVAIVQHTQLKVQGPKSVVAHTVKRRSSSSSKNEKAEGLRKSKKLSIVKSPTKSKTKKDVVNRSSDRDTADIEIAGPQTNNETEKCHLRSSIAKGVEISLQGQDNENDDFSKELPEDSAPDQSMQIAAPEEYLVEENDDELIEAEHEQPLKNGKASKRKEQALKKSSDSKKTRPVLKKMQEKRVVYDDDEVGASDDSTKNEDLHSSKVNQTSEPLLSLDKIAEVEEIVAGELMNSTNLATSNKVQKISALGRSGKLSTKNVKESRSFHASGSRKRQITISPDRSRRLSKQPKSQDRKSHSAKEMSTPVHLKPLSMLPKVTPQSGISFRRKSSFVPSHRSMVDASVNIGGNHDAIDNGTPLKSHSKTSSEKSAATNLKTKSSMAREKILQEENNCSANEHNDLAMGNDMTEDHQRTPKMKSRKPNSLRKMAILESARSKGLKAVYGSPVIAASQRPILNSPFAAHDDSTVLPSPSSTPVHYAETTMTQRRQSNALRLPDLSHKIIQPDCDNSGLRRSKRTRVARLNSYKGEGIIYRRDSSGFGLTVESIQPSLGEAKLIQKEKERHKKQQKRKLRANAVPAKAKRMSTHWSVPQEVTESSDISVVNPDTNENVVIELVSHNSNATWVGPDLTPVTARDSVGLCMLLNQPSFGTGELHIRPLCEKPEQTSVQTVVYFVLHGKVCVTVNNTSFVVESRDDFFIPRGSTYKIKNLRRDIAQLKFLNFYDSKTDVTQSNPSSE